jgi:hypothetical protein
MDFLFSIFEFLIIAGGPFCVFAGMGTGTQSGKLKFRNIVAADSSIEITENSSCVTLKSNGNAVLVPANKIPWGNTSSITWGFLEVDTSVQAITGAYIISNSSNSLIGTSFSSGYNNLIIRPNNNKLFGSSNDNIIINSKESYMCNIGRRSAIIGGVKNVICGGDSVSIIDSYCSLSNESYSSTIISGSSSIICQSGLSTILSSVKSKITYISTGSRVNQNSIISSYCGSIKGNNNSSVISSRQSYINQCNPLGKAQSNSIISSCSSLICGGQVSDGITVGSLRTSILGACCGWIVDSCDSSIIGGYGNIIRTYTYSGGNKGISKNCHNTIVSGFKNVIHAYNTPDSYGSIQYNSIISSKCSEIYNSCMSSIITSGIGNLISNSKGIVIIGGFSGSVANIISYSNQISIINSPNSGVSTSSVGGIVGGFRSCISDGTYIGVIGGICHIIRSSSKNSSILGGSLNSICSSIDSAIVAGRYNCVIGSDRSSILGGYCNIINKVKNSSILGGFENLIDGKSTKGLNSNVILAGCKNTIYGCYGIIVGGEDNYINSCIQYGAILGGAQNTVDLKIGSVIGSCNINTINGSELVITNLIFDKHVYIGSEPATYCGRTGTINLPTSFKIRKGFITTT